jgi:GH15 family glucan-1,4-alpha-glucosidase
MPPTSTAVPRSLHAFEPIDSYGMIGDMRSAALVSPHGSIDWLCLPHFDSLAVFAHLLDAHGAGQFWIRPVEPAQSVRQVYWPDTNILVTRFFTHEGVLEVVDYMPVGRLPVGFKTEAERPRIVRRAQVVRGELEVDVRCEPAFDYARANHRAHDLAEGVLFEGPDLKLALASDEHLGVDGGAGVGRVRLRAGDSFAVGLFVLDAHDEHVPAFGRNLEARLFDATRDYWHRWLGQCTYAGRWREQVYRSALALKLLTFEPTGAIVAAPTLGLPETIGGERNWDYRFSWLRDAAFTIYAFLRIGFTEEAAAFMDWLVARCKECEPNGGLKPVYTIHGDTVPDEVELDHLTGYRHSRPVYAGNGANDQYQLDIYGEVLDAVYLFNKYGQEISYDFWCEIVEMLDWLADHWRDPDDGIWEARSAPRHYVFSKMMCWVAFDRGLRLADKRSFPAPRDRWLRERDAVYLDIMENGWSDERQAFVQHYDSDALDASALIMPLVFFVSPSDSRMIATLEAIMQPPEKGGLTSDSLVDRYHAYETPDGLEGEEGAFNLCTFWLVEALTRAGRTDPEKLSTARLLFEKMMSYSSGLGLFSEETGPLGDALGNYPQGLTHLSLISAAYNLDRALSGKR